MPTNDVNEHESFSWHGKTVHRILDLKTNEIRKISLKALLTEPGVYNLNNFRIKLLSQQDLGEVSRQSSGFISARGRFESIGGPDHLYVKEIRLPD